eukprot:m.76510 g.76510  ORF g.76510 m.76510 type:complete len:115 (-) comp14029_c1_seq1:30-374(-)
MEDMLLIQASLLCVPSVVLVFASDVDSLVPCQSTLLLILTYNIHYDRIGNSSPDRQSQTTSTTQDATAEKDGKRQRSLNFGKNTRLLHGPFDFLLQPMKKIKQGHISINILLYS